MTPKEDNSQKMMLIGIAFFGIVGLILGLHCARIYDICAGNSVVSDPAYITEAWYSSVSADNPITIIISALGEITALPFGLIHLSGLAFSLAGFGWVIGTTILGCFIPFAYFEMKRLRGTTISPDKQAGSSKFMTKKEIAKTYNPVMVQKFDPAKGEDDPNIILAKDLYLSMDGHKTRRNINVLVIGGSGTGKSYSLIKPNLMQMNASFIVTDPSGELMQMAAIPLLEHGYKVKIFSTSDMIHSNVYNPFDYLHDEGGVLDETKVKVMVDTFMKNMSGDKKGGDPFWDKAATAWLTFAVFFLVEFYPESNWNMYNMLRLAQLGKADENASSDTKLDQMVMTAREQNPKAKCFVSYDTFKLAPSKTANSILITLGVNLEPFGSADRVKNMTTTSYLCKRDENGLITEYLHDEEDKLIRDSNNLDLQNLGDQKTALFVNIPSANGAYNFLVSMMYSQMFDVCYTKAEQSCPHRYNIYDSIGTAMKSGFFTKEEAERYLSLCKSAKLIERDEVDYQYKSYGGRTTVTKHPVKRYYLYNEKATDKDVQRDLYYKDPENNKGILMDVYNEQVGKLFLQKFQNASVKQGGLHLPVALRCLLDEFANIGEIPGFNEKLATMRKYWISCTIVLQSFAQIKEKYDKLAEAVIGNCDSIVFLGSSENETDEYMMKKLGKTTIRVRNESMGRGRNGSMSDSFSQTARDLMDAAEVSKMNNDDCIVFVRGFNPFYLKKYSFPNHPNYKLTGDADKSKNVTEQFLEENYLCTPKEEQEEEGINEQNEEDRNVANGDNPDGSGETNASEPQNINDLDDFKKAIGIESDATPEEAALQIQSPDEQDSASDDTPNISLRNKEEEEEVNAFSFGGESDSDTSDNDDDGPEGVSGNEWLFETS